MWLLFFTLKSGGGLHQKSWPEIASFCTVRVRNYASFQNRVLTCKIYVRDEEKWFAPYLDHSPQSYMNSMGAFSSLERLFLVQNFTKWCLRYLVQFWSGFVFKTPWLSRFLISNTYFRNSEALWRRLRLCRVRLVNTTKIMALDFEFKILSKWLFNISWNLHATPTVCFLSRKSRGTTDNSQQSQLSNTAKIPGIRASQTVSWSANIRGRIKNKNITGELIRQRETKMSNN